MKFILGKKLGMTRFFNQERRHVPVTLILAGPCYVVQKRTEEKDGYRAVQVGFEEKRPKKVNRAQQGHFKKAGLEKYFRYLKEFAVGEGDDFKPGDKIEASCFREGEVVKVTGVAKSKGFQGVVKRHGFAGASATHGTKHMLRGPGSIGATTPERVWKGMRMAGRMGGQTVTEMRLRVAQVDAENNILAVRGAVPGNKGTLLSIICLKEIAAPAAE